MKTRPFGRTELQVSRLGLGGHELNELSPPEATRLLHTASDMGINVIDTAECYGQSEELIGQALAGQRDSWYLFSKCGHAVGFDLPDWDPRMLKQSIDRSLQRLQTDYLDLLQLHSCSEQMLKRGEVIEVLQQAREAGKVRYIGYSGDRQAALYAMQVGVFDTLQTSINIADQEAIDLILPTAIAQRTGVIAKRPVANAAWKNTQQTSTHKTYGDRLRKLNYDFLSDEPERIFNVALQFTLSVPGVDLAIVGTTNPDHLRRNCTLLEARPLSSEEFNAIHTRWRTETRWRRLLPGGRFGWHGWT